MKTIKKYRKLAKEALAMNMDEKIDRFFDGCEDELYEPQQVAFRSMIWFIIGLGMGMIIRGLL